MHHTPSPTYSAKINKVLIANIFTFYFSRLLGKRTAWMVLEISVVFGLYYAIGRKFGKEGAHIGRLLRLTLNNDWCVLDYRDVRTPVAARCSAAVWRATTRCSGPAGYNYSYVNSLCKLTSLQTVLEGNIA